MHICKLLFTVVTRHRGVLLVYLVILNLLGLTTGLATASQPSTEPKQATATVAVVDRDGSAISAGIKNHIESIGEVRRIEDTNAALEDATAKGTIEYIVVIPAGFGEQLERAAAQNTIPPVLDTVVSFDSAAGSLMDVRTDAWLNQVYDYLGTVTSSPQEAVRLADEAMAHQAQVQVIDPGTGSLPGPLVAYAKFTTYPVMAFCILAVIIGMATVNNSPVRARMAAAPLTSTARNAGLLITCVLIGLVDWLWTMGLGVGALGRDAIMNAAPQLGIVALAIGANVLVAISAGFLLGQLRASENAANAVANIGGMVLSFLAGAWVPLEWMPDSVVTVSRFTPGYWSCRAISEAATVTSTAWPDLAPLVGYCGITALFGVAIMCIGVMAGRARAAA